MDDRTAARHLDDAELLAMLSGEGPPPGSGAGAHLASCRRCAGELERLVASLADYRSELHCLAERPESYWLARRLALRAELDARSRRTLVVRRWVLAASATALALVAGSGLWTSRAPGIGRLPVRDAAPAIAATPAGGSPSSLDRPDDRDADLLSRVEVASDRRTPDELAPAQALLEELAAPALRGAG